MHSDTKEKEREERMGWRWLCRTRNAPQPQHRNSRSSAQQEQAKSTRIDAISAEPSTNPAQISTSELPHWPSRRSFPKRLAWRPPRRRAHSSATCLTTVRMFSPMALWHRGPFLCDCVSNSTAFIPHCLYQQYAAHPHVGLLDRNASRPHPHSLIAHRPSPWESELLGRSRGDFNLCYCAGIVIRRFRCVCAVAILEFTSCVIAAGLLSSQERFYFSLDHAECLSTIEAHMSREEDQKSPVTQLHSDQTLPPLRSAFVYSGSQLLDVEIS